MLSILEEISFRILYNFTIWRNTTAWSRYFMNAEKLLNVAGDTKSNTYFHMNEKGRYYSARPRPINSIKPQI